MVILDLGSSQAPGWLAFALALVLMAVLALLWLSMRKHLRRADYPDLPEAPAQGAEVPHSPGSPVA
ncbi:MAG: hypothetical protein ACLGHZ_07600 [Actinomycetes bacterium]